MKFGQYLTIPSFIKLCFALISATRVQPKTHKKSRKPLKIKDFRRSHYLAIFLLVSSRQSFLSFSFLHFLCIFSEDDATFGKDISRPNLSFFIFSIKKIERKQKRLARILLHEKRRKRRKYAEK